MNDVCFNLKLFELTYYYALKKKSYKILQRNFSQNDREKKQEIAFSKYLLNDLKLLLTYFSENQSLLLIEILLKSYHFHCRPPFRFYLDSAIIFARRLISNYVLFVLKLTHTLFIFEQMI